MNRYGQPPKVIGEIHPAVTELFLYQYMPIKLAGFDQPRLEPRLFPFKEMIGRVCCDFIGVRGLDAYMQSNLYMTAKRMFVKPDKAFNRQGYHSDGFGTDDLNYIWSDRFPTIFNIAEFTLSPDDQRSLADMESQARIENEITFPDCSIVRLDQFNIHKVAPVTETAIRTFVKLSFSGDRYDLEGNTHNHLLDYDWPMRARESARNVPQSI